MNWSESLSYPFMQHAMIAIIFAGISFPVIGVFILSLNLVPLRFAMMHVALLGGAVGLFLKIDPLLMGLLFCALSSLILGPVSEKMNLGLGATSGFFMTLTLALAFILFYKGNIHVLEAFNILWGNILSLTGWDLVLVITISLFILGVLFLFFKEIQAILYDRELAFSVGIPERRFYYLIVFILGLSIAASMRMIGALLIDAFVLLPATAALIVSRSLKQTFFLSALFGLVSGFAGLYLSFVFDIPTSSAIILVASLVVACCGLLKRKFRRFAKAE
jgi:zinc transport system permease protein